MAPTSARPQHPVGEGGLPAQVTTRWSVACPDGPIRPTGDRGWAPPPGRGMGHAIPSLTPRAGDSTGGSGRPGDRVLPGGRLGRRVMGRVFAGDIRAPGPTPADAAYARGPVGLRPGTVVRVASREGQRRHDLHVSHEQEPRHAVRSRDIPAIREGDGGLRVGPPGWMQAPATPAACSPIIPHRKSKPRLVPPVVRRRRCPPRMEERPEVGIPRRSRVGARQATARPSLRAQEPSRRAGAAPSGPSVPGSRVGPARRDGPAILRVCGSRADSLPGGKKRGGPRRGRTTPTLASQQLSGLMRREHGARRRHSHI